MIRLFAFLGLLLTHQVFAAIVTYEEAFHDLSTTPVSQLDFNISKLNASLNDEADGIKRKRKISYSKKDDEFDYSFELSVSVYDVQAVNCFKDLINPKLIHCEITLSSDYTNSHLHERVKRNKELYQEILNAAKSIIHRSFEPAYLKVTIKKEKEKKIDDPTFANIDIDFLRSLPIDYEVLVIWESGVPFYQDAFFH